MRVGTAAKAGMMPIRAHVEDGTPLHSLHPKLVVHAEVVQIKALTTTHLLQPTQMISLQLIQEMDRVLELEMWFKKLERHCRELDAEKIVLALF